MIGWTVIIPVRGSGKSRLKGLGPARAVVARALPLDTIAAVSRCAAVERIVVVTGDPAVAASVARGVEVIDDPDAGGIDAALGRAAAWIGADVNRASLPGDLPALHPEELGAALEAAAGSSRAVVPDADGTGTTLVTAAAGTPWMSSYGPDSFARHLALGCVALDLPAESGLRCDVDTPDQLGALSDRLGRRTADAWHAVREASVR